MMKTILFKDGFTLVNSTVSSKLMMIAIFIELLAPFL